MDYKEDTLVKSAFDTDNNGKADQWHYHHAEGHVERIEYDKTGNGQVNQWEHFAPDSTKPYKVESDADGDGVVDTIWEVSSH